MGIVEAISKKTKKMGIVAAMLVVTIHIGSAGRRVRGNVTYSVRHIHRGLTLWNPCQVVYLPRTPDISSTELKAKLKV